PKAHRAKQLAERSAAKRGPVKDPVRGRVKLTDETVSGRNPVLAALRAGIPAKALHVAVRIEMDDPVKEALRLCLEQ
ncbi:23S rRNA (guanosine(2251)-2'-O)-methyltransferase RlmB, partial [Micrococcus sp. SIMBA_131]